ncbi:hypothetical protein DA103_05795 [Enterobacter cloacae]|uniref:Uncharacterized protein n=1 Tax=Enterobacter cloacae TaxID=550 RepID=A0A2T4Y3C4_ENTCL|nr:hypothetical protein DA103_05795 [Enterobacter cloacae]
MILLINHGVMGVLGLSLIRFNYMKMVFSKCVLRECSAIYQKRHLNRLLRHTLNMAQVMFNSFMLKIELLISTRLIFYPKNHDKFTIL